MCPHNVNIMCVNAPLLKGREMSLFCSLSCLVAEPKSHYYSCIAVLWNDLFSQVLQAHLGGESWIYSCLDCIWVIGNVLLDQYTAWQTFCDFKIIIFFSYLPQHRNNVPVYLPFSISSERWSGKKGIVIFQENKHVFLDDDYWLQNSNIPSNFVHEITS